MRKIIFFLLLLLLLSACRPKVLPTNNDDEFDGVSPTVEIPFVMTRPIILKRQNVTNFQVGMYSATDERIYFSDENKKSEDTLFCTYDGDQYSFAMWSEVGKRISKNRNTYFDVRLTDDNNNPVGEYDCTFEVFDTNQLLYEEEFILRVN